MMFIIHDHTTNTIVIKLNDVKSYIDITGTIQLHDKHLHIGPNSNTSIHHSQYTKYDKMY